MAKYKSKFPSLGFYANDEFHKFLNGEYSTTDKTEIAVLDKLKEVTKVAEPQAKAAATDKQTTATKPAAKITTAAKAATKAAPAKSASAKKA